MNTILRFCLLFTSFSVVHSFFGLQLSSSSSASLTNLSLSTPATDNNMVVEEVKVGDTVPSITLQEGLPEFGKKDVNISELIAGKKVIIFGVPGAFTPGCSKSHVPSFINAKEELTEKGIDLIICIATNDLYVMKAWGEQSGGTDAGLVFLSDGSAEFTQALGLVMETPMMPRTKRFTLIAENGIVTHYFSSAEESSNTWAPAVLAKL